MRSKLKDMVKSFLFFFFVYDVQIKGLPTILSSRKWSIVLLICLSLFRYRASKGFIIHIPSLTREKRAIYKNYFIGIFGVWCYAFVLAILNRRFSENYVDAKNLSFFLLFSVVVPLFLQTLFYDREDLFKTLIFVGLIQAGIVYALYVSANLRQLFDRIFQTDARFGYVSHNLKVLGLGSGGAALSVLLFLSMYSIGYFILKEQNVITNVFLYSFILFAALQTGRTGFFAGVLLGVIIFWKKLNSRIRVKTAIKMIVVFIMLLICAAMAWKYISNDVNLSERVMKTLSHLKISETINVKSDASFLYIISKMSFPELSLELLYGSGYGRGISLTGVDVQNDIGYVQRFFSLGIIVGLLFYVINFYCFWSLSRKIKKRDFRFFYQVLIITLFILELKESFFYYYLVPAIILLIGLIEKTFDEGKLLWRKPLEQKQGCIGKLKKD